MRIQIMYTFKVINIIFLSQSMIYAMTPIRGLKPTTPRSYPQQSQTQLVPSPRATVSTAQINQAIADTQQSEEPSVTFLSPQEVNALANPPQSLSQTPTSRALPTNKPKSLATQNSLLQSMIRFQKPMKRTSQTQTTATYADQPDIPSKPLDIAKHRKMHSEIPEVQTPLLSNQIEPIKQDFIEIMIEDLPSNPEAKEALPLLSLPPSAKPARNKPSERTVTEFQTPLETQYTQQDLSSFPALSVQEPLPNIPPTSVQSLQSLETEYRLPQLQPSNKSIHAPIEMIEEVETLPTPSELEPLPLIPAVKPMRTQLADKHRPIDILEPQPTPSDFIPQPAPLETKTTTPLTLMQEFEEATTPTPTAQVTTQTEPSNNTTESSIQTETPSQSLPQPIPSNTKNLTSSSAQSIPETPMQKQNQSIQTDMINTTNPSANKPYDASYIPQKRHKYPYNFNDSNQNAYEIFNQNPFKEETIPTAPENLHSNTDQYIPPQDHIPFYMPTDITEIPLQDDDWIREIDQLSNPIVNSISDQNQPAHQQPSIETSKPTIHTYLGSKKKPLEKTTKTEFSEQDKPQETSLETQTPFNFTKSIGIIFLVIALSIILTAFWLLL